jgi:hypothetical protein
LFRQAGVLRMDTVGSCSIPLDCLPNSRYQPVIELPSLAMPAA